MAGVLSSVRSIASKLVAKIQGNPSSSSSTDPHNSIEDLRKLERTLQRIQVVLHDAGEREIRDESVKLWLRELKDVAYEAEDVLDEYHYEVLRSEVEAKAAAVEMANRKRKRVEEDQVCDLITTFCPLKASIPDGMVDGIVEKIREIRMRFDEIAKDREALRLRPEDGERLFDFSIYPPPTSSHIDESGIVGREYDREEVIDRLFSNTGCRFSVLPIVGMGGLGKTTLAQLVYNDPRVRQYFHLMGWVCVSVDFDVLRLTRSILESISKKSCDLTELSALHDALSEEVKGRRVLLVLDDVWNEKRSLWESLQVVFLSAEMVWIIVTTRNVSVANIMQTVPPYALLGLPEEQCRLLFQRHAFGSEYSSVVDRELVEIGKKIVKKCAGLPLAVKALGGLLRGETEIERWKEVLESDLWELDHGEDEILPALRLSYRRLPACLKPCFVYCSSFPKDNKFVKGCMVRLWIAQGYIQPRGSRRIEDIGNDYFDELLRRSFFTLDHRNEVVMHDLMVDLSRSISREEGCTIITVEDARDKSCSVISKARHLYVDKARAYCAVMENLSSHQVLTRLRTFLVGFPRVFESMYRFRSANFGYLRALRLVRLELLQGTISSMKHLRYLNLDCSGSKELPESLCQLYNLQSLDLENCNELTELPQRIGNLVNLRYLSISNGDRIRKLPDSLCHLYNLQTLDLKSCDGVGELPSGIGELINLHHLFLPCRFTGTLGIERLTNLQSLSCFYEGQRGGELEIRELGNVASTEDTGRANHTINQHTQKLSLTWRPQHLTWRSQPSTNKSEVHWYGDVRFPGWTGHPSFSNLTLRLLGCDITKTVILPPLSHLWALRSLSIVGIKSIRRIGHEFYRGIPNGSTAEACTTKGCFPWLKELLFDNMPKWEEWDVVLDVDFPSLRRLTISICSELRRIPALPSLQLLHVYKCENLIYIPLHMLKELRNLHLEACPKLQLLPDEWLPVWPERVEIIGCPILQDWCHKHNLSYFQVMPSLTHKSYLIIESFVVHKIVSFENVSSYLAAHQEPSAIKELAISKSLEITSETSKRFPLLEYLSLRNCLQKHLPTYEWILPSLKRLDLFRCNLLLSLHLHQNLSALETLNISSCLELSSVVGLYNITSLKHLVIRDCPEIRLFRDEWLPSTLQSLEFSKCGNLRSLPHLHQGLSALAELHILNCCKLASVNGLNNLTSLQTLSIKHCPELELSPSERLSSMPKHVHITCCPGLREWCKRHSIP